MMLFLIVTVLCFVSANVVDGVTKPRGVPLAKISFYKPGATFTCFDGSATIPFTRVNDDYCDCRDASDEPGTSACLNGMFYCENKSHKPTYIPSSRVDDGVCDCCDGSDELGDLVTCSNNCIELGKMAMEASRKHLQTLEAGHKIYQEYVQQAQIKIDEKRNRLDQIENEIANLEEKKTELERIKNEAEIPEKNVKELHDKLIESIKQQWQEAQDLKQSEKAFVELDVNQDERIALEEMQNHKEFDADKDGEVSALEVNELLSQEDWVNMATFKEKVWPNIKATYKSLEVAESPNLSEASRDDEDPSKLREPIETKVEEQPQLPDYDENEKSIIEAATNARKNFDEVENEISNLKNEKNTIKTVLDRDHGPDHVYLVLSELNECYEVTDREYVYKLCLFKDTSQRSNDGSHSTSLGHWGKWSGDENKGGLYTQMHYEKGQSCWNGPDRNTKVQIVCGSTNQLLKAEEPSRCEYRFDFATPAACSESPKDFNKEENHDEL